MAAKNTSYYRESVIGFGIVLTCVLRQFHTGQEAGLAIAGLGYGVVMPSVIKAIISNVAPQHAGLASGIVMTTLQIGAALGVAVVGGVFYSVLGTRSGTEAYAHAFSTAIAVNIALLFLGGVLSRYLPNDRVILDNEATAPR